ncbi:MAG: DUF3127 domain-containing protein [Bacteroidetes bacterium]|nr:DUF3127 domain-containing protein [Bacteroidota bacterium]
MRGRSDQKLYFYGNFLIMQITGTLKVKKEEQAVNDRFKKREFVLVDNSSQYPQFISFQLTQDRCTLLDPVQTGETITVHFNLRGREWTSPQGEIKYFNTLEAWKIDRNAAGGSTSYDQAPEYMDNAPVSGKDDLPF